MDLTPRQRQVLALVWDGLTRPAIAHRLGIGRSTVERNLDEARRRVGVESTIALLRWWLEHEPPRHAAWAEDWTVPAMDVYNSSPST